MKELIISDSDSTDTVFCNPKCISNIQDSDNQFSINTIGGIMKSHQKCDIPYINDVWYNKKYITNIINMKDMTNKYCVTIYPKEELTLLIHMPNKIVKSKQFLNGSYAMDPNYKKSFVLTKKEYEFMNTLEENLKCLSMIKKD